MYIEELKKISDTIAGFPLWEGDFGHNLEMDLNNAIMKIAREIGAKTRDKTEEICRGYNSPFSKMTISVTGVDDKERISYWNPPKFIKALGELKMGDVSIFDKTYEIDALGEMFDDFRALIPPPRAWIAPESTQDSGFAPISEIETEIEVDEII
jgi:hypothetical protein